MAFLKAFPKIVPSRFLHLLFSHSMSAVHEHDISRVSEKSQKRFWPSLIQVNTKAGKSSARETWTEISGCSESVEAGLGQGKKDEE